MSPTLLLTSLSFKQALKLVKQIMAVDSSWLPREVVRTVVAVSGHKEDNFRRVGQESCVLHLQEATSDTRKIVSCTGPDMGAVVIA